MKDKNALVSIVMPTLNQGSFIPEAIDSALSQDYPNLEVIVVDGISKDNTLEILASYGDRITWLSEKDRNLTNAINKGIKISKGKYIHSLASDEVLYEGAISKLVSEMQNTNADIVVGNGSMIDQNSRFIADIDNGENGLSFEDVITLKKKMPFACSFFKREVFEAYPFDEDFLVCTDYDFWLRVFNNLKIVFIPEKTTMWRHHDDSWSVNRKAAYKIFEARIQAFDKFFVRGNPYAYLRAKALFGAYHDLCFARFTGGYRLECLRLNILCFLKFPFQFLGITGDERNMLGLTLSNLKRMVIP